MEHSCKNCKYYVPHYIKRGSQLREVIGHCTKKTYPKRYRGAYILHNTCEEWKEKEPQIDCKREIIKTLENMEKHLADIALLLQDDTAENTADE